MLKRALESLVASGFADHTEGNNLFQVRYCDIGECHIFGNGYDYDDAIHYADTLSYGENSVVTQCHGSGGCQLFSVGMFESGCEYEPDDRVGRYDDPDWDADFIFDYGLWRITNEMMVTRISPGSGGMVLFPVNMFENIVESTPLGMFESVAEN
jgi:hypothetical protein